MGSAYEIEAPDKGASKYEIEPPSRPDFSKNPPPAAGPHVDMQPSAMGSVGSIPPDMAQKGRVAAGKAYGGVSTGRATYSNDMSDPQPKYPIPTPQQDASNAAIVGTTLSAPFTGGLPLLSRVGLMGAGAATGSGAAQLADTGKLDANQTAGDASQIGALPELGLSGLGTLTRNSDKILPTALGALKGGAEKIPIAGPIASGAIRGGLKAYRAASVIPEEAGEAMQLSAPRNMIPSEAPAIESIPDKPSGRLILSPEEAQAETQQMRLAKKLASQRGMQYAAGQRPSN